MTAPAGTDEYPTILFNRYRVEATLGQGGFSTVLKAYDLRIKRLVAIKMLKPALATDPDRFRAIEERFTREAEAASRMGVHPHVIAVYDLATDTENAHYLILEYIAGGTLAQRLRHGPLPPSDALRIAADAARGLHAAHQTGIVHRDIKPANIFLTLDGRAQVGDFGIAQIDDLSNRTQTLTGHPGTPLYMSPEQERQTAYLRPSTDQYSLGLVLFEMLTGMAYKRLEPDDAMRALDSQPPALAGLVRRMTAFESRDRYATMADVVTAIDAVPPALDQDATPTEAAATIIPSLAEQATPATIAPPQTPIVNLQPVAPVARPPVSQPVAVGRQYSRRAVLVTVGGLIVAGGGAGAVAYAIHGSGGTATPTHAPPTATDAVRAGTRLRVVTDAVLRVRPESTSQIVVTLRAGDVLIAQSVAVFDSTTQKWYPVMLQNGATAYVRADFVTA